MDGDAKGRKQLFLSEEDTLVYANNTHSIMHGVEKIGDHDVC